MWLEQAVFTSSKTRHGEGYHVVAKSPGISNDISVALTRWCPSHAALQSSEVNAESLNFHPLTDDTLAVSRTTYGVKEFSGRGGLQVVTMAIVLRRKQLAGYENHAIRLARVARSLGHLRWIPQFPERLTPIELPDSVTSESLLAQHDPPEAFALDDAVRLLCNRQRIAVVTGTSEELVETILNRLSTDVRASCYFTTGLKWFKQRPYRIQILLDIDPKIRRRLEAYSIRLIEVAPCSQPSS